VIERHARRVVDQLVPPYSKDIGPQPLSVTISATRKSIALVSLDRDREPEVVLSLFSGAAHCCFWTRIYDWNATAGRYASLAHRWGNVDSKLVDADGDGALEIVSSDDRFAYEFASFADSAFPIQIWSFRDGRLVDTTRRYPSLVAEDAARQWRWYRRHRRRGEVRGFLAAWAADQCLLGRGKAALQAVRRVSPENELQSGSKAAYLRSLRAFLRRTGYLH
jgi:hypothetical protein